MNTNTKSALSIFEYLETLRKENDEKLYNITLNNVSHLFRLTEIEIAHTPIEFQNFIIDNGYLVKSLDKYKMTEALEDFNYNLERINTHLKFSELAYEYIEYVAQSNLDSIEKELGYDINELTWEDFLDNLNKSRHQIFYEQALVNLITLFEVYMSDIIKWIYKNVPDAQQNLKVNLTYGDILRNLDNLIDYILNDQFFLGNWTSKNKELQTNLKFNWKNIQGGDKILEAIDRRNLIVHNRGLVDSFYAKKYSKKAKINDSITINRKYYMSVHRSVKNVAKKLDKIIIEKVKV